jgi:hypothetical protein
MSLMLLPARKFPVVSADAVDPAVAHVLAGVPAIAGVLLRLWSILCWRPTDACVPTYCAGVPTDSVIPSVTDVTAVAGAPAFAGVSAIADSSADDVGVSAVTFVTKPTVILSALGLSNIANE